MARRKKNEKVILEDIELKPQVIGYTYQKKSNIGRVIFIFIAFALVVYYINDISVFINDLIGKDSPESIQGLAGSNEDDDNESENTEKNEVEFHVYQNGLNITEANLNLNNFNLIDNKLSFDIVNNTKEKIDLSKENYYIELYNESKTLLERINIDINTVNENSKVSYQFDIKNTFYYLTFEKKSIDDYPVVNLNKDELGVGSITCTKDINVLVYTFRNDKLESIKHTISDSNITGEKYYQNYNTYQNRVSSYNALDGFTATFNGTLNGYTAIIQIDLQKANLNTIEEKYYYGYNELPKVVKFEMQTYGFNCM